MIPTFILALLFFLLARQKAPNAPKAEASVGVAIPR